MSDPADGLLTPTREALAAPRPGDRFHEMYSWWTVVVAAGPWGVTVLMAGGPFNLVRGQVRNSKYPQKGDRRKRGPEPEWVEVAPWQERAELRHFPTLEAFAAHMWGELLRDRGLDVSGWPQQRAAANQSPTPLQLL